MIMETPGIGQGDSEVVDHVDFALYVMTPDYGAASQLEKIDMLDHAERGRHQQVRSPWRGGRPARRPASAGPNGAVPGAALEDLPVFGTVASRFADDGVTVLYLHLRDELASKGLRVSDGRGSIVGSRPGAVLPRGRRASCPAERERYLAEIAETIRGYHATATAQAEAATRG